MSVLMDYNKLLVYVFAVGLPAMAVIVCIFNAFAIKAEMLGTYRGMLSAVATAKDKAEVRRLLDERPKNI